MYKLEKIVINNIEYYQWVKIDSNYPFTRSVGDIFSKWEDIADEKQKLINYYEKN